jgi:outer membrane lipoprotein-sorting protein
MKILIILLISTSAWAEFLPKSFSAKLVQKHMSVISEKEVRTEGRIDYRYPKDLYVKLQEVVFVANKNQSWYYTPPFKKDDKGTVIIHDPRYIFLTKFFETLKRGLKDNTYYTVKDTKDGILLSFKEELHKGIGLKKVLFPTKLKVAKVKSIKDISKMVFTKSDDSELTFELEDMNFQKEL